MYLLVLNISYKWYYKMCDFVPGFLAIIFLILILVVVSISTSFLFTDEYYSIVYMYRSSFTHLFIDAHCFFPPFLALVNTATENITAHVFWGGFQDFGYFM